MIELIIGGVRSGKSAYALSRAEALGGDLQFIATARVPAQDEAQDAEMRARISRHQAERGRQWSLTECPMRLANVAGDFNAGHTVLVDCLTLWLTNWLCAAGDSAGDSDADAAIYQWRQERDHFIKILKVSQANWLLVSNESGLGVTPTGSLSRRYLDECGWMHQAIAKASDKVTLVMFGLPQTLK